MIDEGGGGYDVLVWRVDDINHVNDRGSEKETTDGAELIGRATMHHIIQHYKHQNPQSHLDSNLCAFQGRVGPTKGVWVVWPDHIIVKRMGGHPGGGGAATPPMTGTYCFGTHNGSGTCRIVMTNRFR